MSLFLIFIILMIILILNNLFNKNKYFSISISLIILGLISFTIPINDNILSINQVNKTITLNKINYFYTTRAILNFENRYYFRETYTNNNNLTRISKQKFDKLILTYKKLSNNLQNPEFKINLNDK